MHFAPTFKTRFLNLVFQFFAFGQLSETNSIKNESKKGQAKVTKAFGVFSLKSIKKPPTKK
ncbi:MAG: hypothetical protein CL840_17080 [Crocinitomicaceae bacterium]|nr:hypothetical protein [Crocinitomicaceae bacterium]